MRVSAAAVVALTAATLIALPSSAPTAAGNGAGTVLVSGGTLVDGTGREPLPDATIVVRDGRVAEVTAGGVARGPAGTERIDARGKWIVPGLIDMHVHYHPGWMDALFLRQRVTTVRDGQRAQLSRAARGQPSPGVARPTLACGPLVDGPSPRHGAGVSVSVRTVAEARVAGGARSRRGLPEDLRQLTPPLVGRSCAPRARAFQ